MPSARVPGQRNRVLGGGIGREAKPPSEATRGEPVAHYPEPVARLIEALQKLPGIGPKTA